MKGYFTVNGECEYTTVIEKSKFICYIRGIETEEDAKNFIEEVRKRHSFAKHNCYAYIADEKGLNQKFSDAGEPQGTAGLPMLNALKSKKIFKTVAVVARYFGGIKLGTGGLTRAYGGAVAECLKNAKIIDVEPVKFVDISTDYDGYSKILKIADNKTFSIVKTSFEVGVIISVAVVNENENSINTFIEKVADLTKGKAQILSITDGFYPFN